MKLELIKIKNNKKNKKILYSLFRESKLTMDNNDKRSVEWLFEALALDKAPFHNRCPLLPNLSS